MTRLRLVKICVTPFLEQDISIETLFGLEKCSAKSKFFILTLRKNADKNADLNRNWKILKEEKIENVLRF